jgi:broad specificity phosphatase PhoE
MSEILLVRHGQASFGQRNYDALSPTGVRQAACLAEHCLAAGLRFDALYSGPMERQKDSARHFAAEYMKRGIAIPPLSISEGFSEYDTRVVIAHYLPKLIESDPSFARDREQMFKSLPAFRRIFETAVIAWVTDPRCNEIESWPAFCERVQRSLQRIMVENGRGKRVAVFTSGGAIAAALKHVLDTGDELSMRLCWQIVNTSVTRFKYNERGIALASFNGYAHLECLGNTELITYK